MQFSIKFNNEEVMLQATTALHELLTEKGLAEKKGIAVAVNENVIPRKDWDTYILNENDSVLVIKATQGG
jgi:sulfur carrier protein